MGYNIYTIDCHVRIPAHNQIAAAGVVDGGDVLEAAWDYGFESCHFTPQGSFILGYYGGKSGNEDDFLDLIAPYVVDGSYITWRGEDDLMWADVFMDGKRYSLEVYIRVKPPQCPAEDEEEAATYAKILKWIDKQGVA